MVVPPVVEVELVSVVSVWDDLVEEEVPRLVTGDVLGRVKKKARPPTIIRIKAINPPIRGRGNDFLGLAARTAGPVGLAGAAMGGGGGGVGGTEALVMEERAVKVVGGGVTAGGTTGSGVGRGEVAGTEAVGAVVSKAGVEPGGVTGGMDWDGVESSEDGTGGGGTKGLSGVVMVSTSEVGSDLSVEGGGVRSSPAPLMTLLDNVADAETSLAGTELVRSLGGVGLGRVISGISNTHQKHYW